MKKYISKENFKIYNSCPQYIPIDSGVADAVAKLLELGYEVSNGLDGEYDPIVYLRENLSLSDLDNYKDSLHTKSIKIKEDSFDCWCERFKSCIYIFFDKKYKFKTLPQGFTLHDYEGTDRERY